LAVLATVDRGDDPGGHPQAGGQREVVDDERGAGGRLRRQTTTVEAVRLACIRIAMSRL
jgi:hypothetical protein